MKNSTIIKLKELISRKLRRIKLLFLIIALSSGAVLSSCSVGLHGRGYDDRYGYYQREGDYYSQDRPFHSRLERHRYEREHRRWHRLHDHDRNFSHDEIEIGR